EAAQVRHEAGALADLDLRQTRQQVAQAELQLESDRRALATARRTLNQLLGRPLDEPIEPAETELRFEPADVDLEAALESALSKRLEILQAQDRVETARINLELAQNPYTPRLDQARAQLQLQQAEQALAQARRKVEMEVRSAYDAVKAAEAQVPLRQEAAALAVEQLRIARLRFEAGTITSLDVTEAQQRAFEAQVSALNALFDYRISLARFFQAAQLAGLEGAVID
ncbi:MAG: TolC family protein, partial [Bacillota bacterium]